MDYNEFIAKKARVARKTGMSNIPELSDVLFDHQRAVVAFLLECGSGAAFLDTGMGKTLVAFEWARQIIRLENKPILMLAPLAVGKQHYRSAQKFGYDDVYLVRNQSEVKVGLNITNYENLHNFMPDSFCGIILDESSILKSFGGKTSLKLINSFACHRWRLALTATPSPNDHMELGQHSAFVGAMPSHEMLARWFIADQKQMGAYRLKRHGVKDFWRWVASWSRCACKPSDLGFSDDGFELKPLIERKIIVKADIMRDVPDGMLFRIPEQNATSIHNEKRLTIKARAEAVAKLASELKENQQFAIWCDTDYEADELKKQIPQAIEVRGSMTPAKKEELIDAFSTGEEQIIITKPKVAGYGVDWQNCHRTAFAGLSYSYENYYQAIRRFQRYGQQKQVIADLILSDTESALWRSIQKKMRAHETMKMQMAAAMKDEVIKKETRLAYIGDKQPTMPNFLKGE